MLHDDAQTHADINGSSLANRIFLATTGKGLARAEPVDGQWEVTHLTVGEPGFLPVWGARS